MAYDTIDGVRYPKYAHPNWHIDYNYSLKTISDRERAVTTQTDTNTTSIGTNATDIGTNTTNIGTNTTNISTNTTNIGTNTTDIATNTAAIAALDVGGSSYVIPLVNNGIGAENQWTITEGDNRQVPVVGYSQGEWDIAYNNKIGIGKALNYAVTNGYQSASLPIGHYNICYSNVAGDTLDFIVTSDNEIVMPSFLRFDGFNSVTISVLWDSDTTATSGAVIRNPYDAGAYDPMELRGNVFAFSKTYKSSIHGIKIIGEQGQRSFVDPDESKKEHNTGVYVREGSTDCYCSYVETIDFSGDGHSGLSTHNSDYGLQLPDSEVRTFYPGELNRDDGTIDAGITTSYTTALVSLDNIDRDVCDSIVMRTNLGFQRIPEFVNQKIILAWYDESDVFINSEDFSFLEITKIPVNAAKIRMGCMGEADSLASIFFTLRITPPVPENYGILDCTIKECNRGGISNVPNRTLIANNKIYNNGTGWKEGRTEFFYDTQYLINTEDSLPHSVRIINNELSGSRHGILTSGVNIFIIGNTISNCEGSGITMYYMINAVITNNSFNNCNIALGIIEYSRRRHITTANNIIEGGLTAELEIATSGYDYTIDGGQANTPFAIYKPHVDRVEDFTVRNHVYNQTPLLDGTARHEYLRGTFNSSTFNLLEDQVSTNQVYINSSKDSDNFIVNCSDANRIVANEGTFYGLTQNGGKQFNFLLAAADRTYNFYGEHRATLNPDVFEFPQFGAPTGTTHTLNFYDYTIKMNGGFSWMFNMDTNSTAGTTTLNMNFYNCDFVIDDGIGGTLFYIDYAGASHNVNININYGSIDTMRTSETVYLAARHGAYPNLAQLTRTGVTMKGSIDDTATGFNLITV